MFTRSLIILSLLTLCCGRAEVIYDNSQFGLGGYASERVEYGDQIDLEGTARTLTELTFYYYGDFVPDGNEAMKVRLYSNETVYDLYRNSPTRLLYESGAMPFSPGYNSRTLSNLNVQLPLDSLTFTIEFKGLLTNEVAGLLFYGPPTTGASFNEFWERSANGNWFPFYYSLTDPSRKANAGLKLVARTESAMAATQTSTDSTLALRDTTNSVRLAQTFTPLTGGRLDRLGLLLEWTGAPVQISVLDTQDGQPGTNRLGFLTVTNTSAAATANFYNQQIYLSAGELYAIECRTESGRTEVPQYLLSCSTNDAYTGGQLWAGSEPDGAWEPAALPSGLTNIDAAFSVSITPAAPPVRITSPAVDELIPAGKTVRFAAELHLPRISELWRVRFFDGDNEINELINPPSSKPPYEIAWQPATLGQHRLKVIVEDGFRRPFRTDIRTVTVVPSVPSIARLASIKERSDGAMTLRFDTAANERVRIEYSEDLEHWKPAAVEAVGTGLEISYDDEGPPRTSSHPKVTPRRYYRVRFGEQ